ncbi:MAG: MarC family protein [Candidatus Omnitrophica bacterium]|nr:MarC family protein [Candidatus Omnitrophota bacterium]
MFKTLEPYVLTFIQIFVAVDSLGNIPLFISLIEGVGKKHRHKIIIESVTTATVMAVLFLLIGKWILRFIGVTIPDFQVAGGVLLFVIALRLLLPGTTRHFLSDGHNKEIGVFPLGTPLITGPAVLTTTLIMLDTFGPGPTLVSLVLNMLIVWFTLVKADGIMKIMGVSGTRAFAKIMYILLAAIGVMMVRRGIMGIFSI